MAKQEITVESANRISRLVEEYEWGGPTKDLLLDHLLASLSRHHVHLFQVVHAGLLAMGGVRSPFTPPPYSVGVCLTTSNWASVVERLLKRDLSWYDSSLVELLSTRGSLGLSEMAELKVVANKHLSMTIDDVGEEDGDFDDGGYEVVTPSAGVSSSSDHSHCTRGEQMSLAI